jgi:hypothetical protein
VAAGFGAQVGDEVVGHALPVGGEVDAGRVDEREACAVGRLLPAREQRGVERAPEPVGGEVVDARVAHERRRAHGVEDALDRRPDALRHRTAASRRRRRVRGAGEVEEVVALGVVELQGTGERLEHAVGDAEVRNSAMSFVMSTVFVPRYPRAEGRGG